MFIPCTVVGYFFPLCFTKVVVILPGCDISYYVKKQFSTQYFKINVIRES